MALRAVRRFSRCAFTDLEHERWQAAVGAYDRLFGPLTRQAAGHLAGLVVARGGRGLDCATGPGYVIEEALARGSCGEQLVGVDFSAAMLSVAQHRIAQDAGVTWKEVDIQEPMSGLPGPFAWCTCNFGVLHLARPESFFRNVKQILQPGGFFTFTVWAQPSMSPAFRIALEAIQEHGETDVGLPPGPPFFKYSDENIAKEDLVEAGFEASSITSTVLDMTMTLNQPSALWEGFYDGTARTGALLARQTPEAKFRIRKAMEDAVVANSSERSDSLSAPYTFKQPCLVVTASVPTS